MAKIEKFEDMEAWQPTRNPFIEDFIKHYDKTYDPAIDNWRRESFAYFPFKIPTAVDTGDISRIIYYLTGRRRSMMIRSSTLPDPKRGQGRS